MLTVTTRHDKQIVIISAADLRDPRCTGSYVRAYCHIHGSDHQRSLSIKRATGWGHCFNAACQEMVLVAEWNPQVAGRLVRYGDSESDGLLVLSRAESRPLPLYPPAREVRQGGISARQMVLLPPEPEIPRWQRDEMVLLQTLEQPLRHALRQAERGRCYLEARGIPYALARMSGVGYLSDALFTRLDRSERQRMARWNDRLIFPLTSPTGRGYIGRTLRGWRAGMDENQHKALLDRSEGTRRWIKTNPAGWFCCNFERLADYIVLVEGGFDRLALIQAGFRPRDVVALVGTSAHIDWLPLYAPQVKGVVLALDCDQGGREAARKLAEQCQAAELAVRICEPVSDRQGKDWNERWRRMGRASMYPLYEAYRALRWRARSA